MSINTRIANELVRIAKGLVGAYTWKFEDVHVSNIKWDQSHIDFVAKHEGKTPEEIASRLPTEADVEINVICPNEAEKRKRLYGALFEIYDVWPESEDSFDIDD